MEMQEMEITIDAEGRIKVTVTGAHNAECLEITKKLEEAAGIVEERIYSPAYYEQTVSPEQYTRIRNS